MESQAVRPGSQNAGKGTKPPFTGASMFMATAAALIGCAARTRRKASTTSRHAFSSSSSGFMGTAVASSSIVVLPADSTEMEAKVGVAGMSMKHAKWFSTNIGQEGKAGRKFFALRRRESRRRGEELFMHDVDNFEMTLNNVICAPGAKKPNPKRLGRGQYGNFGRSCGHGIGGVKGRKGFESNFKLMEGGNQKTFRVTHPKLTAAQKLWMRHDPYSHIPLSTLELLGDGDSVDMGDLQLMGLPVKKKGVFPRTKVIDKDDFVLTKKYLTVFANAFVPSAKEKIEALGGKCIRLDDKRFVPVDEGFWGRRKKSNWGRRKKSKQDEAGEKEEA